MRVFFVVMLAVVPLSGRADDFFEQRVARVLVTRCLECHKGAEPSGGLSFENGDRFHAGGDSGSAVETDSATDSLLLQRIRDEEMPPPVKGVVQSLPPAEREVLQEWIERGAVWPDGRSLDLYEVTTDVRGGRDWWSFQPVQQPTVPGADDGSIQHPVDAFVQARLTEAQMQPAPPSSSRVLVRRLFLDVIGLPPSYEQLQEWEQRLSEADQRDQEIAALVDQLLSSPQFGERWARYWLDLVRYAESSGYERDQPKAFAWKYRDWVVDALNNDMPYDRFILHQLAGDEIEDRSEQSVIATGFMRLGTWNDEPNDPADYQYERLEDMVHATTSSFLGLTVKCARCHDHKFDPIPQDDYYRIASVFWPGPIAARDAKYLGGPSADELGTQDVLGWTDLSASPSPLHLLKNGERHHPLHVPAPGPLSLAPELYADFAAPADGSMTTGRRRQLAEWVIRPDNPLTARVLVNRIWQHHFGEAIVRSPNNFGFKGDLPTHPQLLDWLAAELMNSNWSMKHIHRLILTSATWQQSSVHPLQQEYAERDPSNRLWWRSQRRRMDAEALRDSLLSATGELDLSRVGGESFKPTFSAEALEGLSRKGSDRQAAPPDQQRRRSLYIYVSRSLMPPMMTTFDQCDTTLPCGQRDVTTTPTQALAMLNNDFVHERSEALAVRAESLAESTDEQIRMVWRLALGRDPAADEQQLASRYLAQQRQRFESLTKPSAVPGSKVAEIPVPVLHLAADGDVVADGRGRVHQWRSATGQHHAIQPDEGAQPQLVQNGFNGAPVVRFSGAGAWLSVEGEFLSNAECTVLAVASDRAEQPGLREIISNWNREQNSVTSVFLGLRDQKTIRFSDNFSSAGSLRNPEEPFLLTARNSAAGAFVWQSRLLIASRVQPLTGRRLGTQWVIGQQGNINGEFWQGDIAEILVFDLPLTDIQLQAVWSRLIEKYALTDFPDAGVLPAHDTSPAHRSLASLCHVLLNSNEFLYID